MQKSLLVLMVLAACGDDGVHKLADAPPAPDDAQIDAPNSGVVTLTVIQDGSPRPGVDVYFLNGDNTVVAKMATNAQGVATATMVAGGSVTAIDPFLIKSSGHDLRTFVGVKPGDNLHLTQGGTAAQNVEVNFEVVLPGDSFASTYELHSNCGSSYFSANSGSGSGSGSIGGPTSWYGCGATVDVLLQTFDFNGNAVGAIYKAGVALTEGGTLDLTSSAYTTPLPNSTINWSNIPAAYTGLQARVVLASSKGVLSTISLNPGPITAGAASLAFPRPTVTNGIEITQTQPSQTTFAAQGLVDWAPQASTPVAVDVGAGLLATYAAAPSVSGATRTVTWSAGAGASPDFVWATLRASRPAGKSSTFWDWDIVVPYGSTTFTLPLLPTEVAQYNFAATDSVEVSELITAKVPGGYDAVRGDILTSEGPHQFVTGATGRIAYENLPLVSTGRTLPSLRSWSNRPRPLRK